MCCSVERSSVVRYVSWVASTLVPSQVLFFSAQGSPSYLFTQVGHAESEHGWFEIEANLEDAENASLASFPRLFVLRNSV